MSGPLRGLRVIELAGIGPAPFAGMMLADMGAEVVRIDRAPEPLGQPQTELRAIFGSDRIVGRGRRSIALNMKDPRATDVVLRLVRTSDALIEGFRPGVAERLGVGPDACHEANPKLVYGRMTGWGQDGPLAQAAGHDLNYISLSGAAHAIGRAGEVPTVPLNLIGDYGGGGMLLALGVVAALFEAQRSGRGQVVDAAISDGAAILMAPLFGMLADGAWRDAREDNFIDGAAPFYRHYRCADDRYVAVGAIEPQFYQLLLKKLALPDVNNASQWDRSGWQALAEKLARVFAGRTRDAWCEVFDGTDACVGPVLSMHEVAAHPHNRARSTFVERDGAAEPTPAPRFSRTTSSLPAVAPRRGADTASVLDALGFAPGEISALAAAGVVHLGDGA